MNTIKAVCDIISRRGRLGAVLIVPVLVAACDMAGPVSRSDNLGPVFEAVYPVALPAGLAEQMAENCPDLAFDAARYQEELDRVFEGLMDQGMTQEELAAGAAAVDRAALSRRTRADEAAFIEQNGIVFAEPETVCRAGKSEIAEGSAVGAFLSEA